MTEENTAPNTDSPEKAEETSAEETPKKETSTETKEKTSSGAEKDQKGTAKEEKSDRRGGRGRGGRRGRGRGGRREPKEFEESILQIDRVTRVTRGGRQLRFRISVIIGDKKGRVGFAMGKSSEVMLGIKKAVSAAKSTLIKVPTFNGTIPHPVEATFKSTKVTILPAPEGKGLIAGGAVRKILELAGVKDVLSKVHGSRNGINVAYATFKALGMLMDQEPLHLRNKKKAEDPTAAKAPVGKPSPDAPEESKPKKTAAKKKAAPKKAAPKKKDALAEA